MKSSSNRIWLIVSQSYYLKEYESYSTGCKSYVLFNSFYKSFHSVLLQNFRVHRFNCNASDVQSLL